MDLTKALNKKTKEGDVAATFFVRGKKVLIGLKKYTDKEWENVLVWTPPSGRSKNGETLEETARHKAKQEVNITDFTFTDYLGIVPGAKRGDKVYLFMAKTSQEPQMMQSSVMTEWKWCPIDEVPSNFINPEALELLKKSV